MGIENNNRYKRSSKLLPYIIFGINLIVVMNLFIANYENRDIILKQKNEKKLDSITIKTKEEQIVNLQSKFQKMIIENRAMGLTISVMESSMKELEKLKKDVQAGKIPLSVLEKKISSIQKKYLDGKMKSDSLMTNLSFVRESTSRREDSLMKLINSYEEKLEKASVIRAENIQISVVNGKGSLEKQREKYKTRVVKTIKVNFTLANTPTARHCSRNFFLKIEGPEGDLLRDEDSPDLKKSYTCRSSLYFTNTQQEVNFLYEAPNKLKPGKYNIALYSEENKIGEEILYLK